MKRTIVVMAFLLSIVSVSCQAMDRKKTQALISVGLNMKCRFFGSIDYDQPKELAKIRELLDQGAEVNSHTGEGFTILWFAVRRDKREIVSYLLERNADPNFESCDEDTPLDLAVGLGKMYNSKNPVITQMLKDHISRNETSRIYTPWMGNRQEGEEKRALETYCRTHRFPFRLKDSPDSPFDEAMKNECDAMDEYTKYERDQANNKA